MIKAIIIDDEQHCIHTLQHLLKKYQSVAVAASITDSRKAIEAIHIHKPDIVFLDIEMPFMNGFQVMEGLDEINFQLLFTTAYDQYAIKALRMNAIDYLLKPIDREEFDNAMKNVFDRALSLSAEQTQHLLKSVRSNNLATIALSTGEGLIFVNVDDIIYIEAKGAYTSIILKNNIKHLVSKNIATFTDMLENNPLFFRPHKSYIIHLKAIQKYIRGDGGEIIMQDNTSIPLSRIRKQDFLSLFSRI